MHFPYTISQVVSSIVAIIVIAGFLSYPTQGYALSCMPRKVKFIAICQEGLCTDGFAIDFNTTGSGCRVRPIVRGGIYGNINVVVYPSEAFHIASEYNQNKNITSGIYELSTLSYCLKGKSEVAHSDKYWEQTCKSRTNITKLSDSTDQNVLQHYKGEWQTKEQEGLRAVTVEKWKGVATIIVIDLLVIIWPLLFLWAFPLLRKHILLLLLPAIAIQVYTATTMLWSYMWSYSLLQDVAAISIILVYITALIYALYVIGSFIYRKLSRKTITT